MSEESVAAHPIAAELASAIVQDPRGLHFAEGAVDRARAALRGVEGEDVVVHLLALGIKTNRIAGTAGQPILVDLALLIAERLGGAAAAADRFANAGLSKDAAAALGAAVVSRAPEHKPQGGPAVKPKRGLS